MKKLMASSFFLIAGALSIEAHINQQPSYCIDRSTVTFISSSKQKSADILHQLKKFSPNEISFITVNTSFEEPKLALSFLDSCYSKKTKNFFNNLKRILDTAETEAPSQTLLLYKELKDNGIDITNPMTGWTLLADFMVQNFSDDFDLYPSETQIELELYKLIKQSNQITVKDILEEIIDNVKRVQGYIATLKQSNNQKATLLINYYKKVITSELRICMPILQELNFYKNYTFKNALEKSFTASNTLIDSKCIEKINLYATSSTQGSCEKATEDINALLKEIALPVRMNLKSDTLSNGFICCDYWNIFFTTIYKLNTTFVRINTIQQVFENIEKGKKLILIDIDDTDKEKQKIQDVLKKCLLISK